MAKGGFPGMGGFGGNMGNLMKQAQKMQNDMKKLEEEMADKTVEATAGGGAVTVVVTCKKQIKEITIKPEVVDPEDVEMLQDLVLAAVNEAMRQAEELYNSEVTRITGFAGGMPGLF